MKHILSRQSLSSTHAPVLQKTTPIMALATPTLRLVKYTGMALFVAASLSLSACGDKDAATQTPPSSSDEPAATSTETTETQAPEVATAQTETTDTEQAADTDNQAEGANTNVDTDSAEASVTNDAAEAETPEAAAPEPELAAGAGKELYESHCKQCHEGGLLGAPKFGDKAAWATRIEQGKDTLYIHSAKGYKKMPAQATGDVSVAQVHAAVDYMVEHSS